MPTYRYTKNPVRIGQIRHKAWSWLIPPASEHDPVWAQRAKDYWELQQETYGLKLSNFTISIDWDAKVVLTYVIVLDVLPGERRVDYLLTKVREARAKQRSLAQTEEAPLVSADQVPKGRRACPACGGIGLHLPGCVVVGAMT